MLIDTHAHLNDSRYSEEKINEIICGLKANNLEKIICASFDISSSLKAKELSSKFNEIYYAVGVHPFNLENLDENYLSILENLITEKTVAIGEIGLDYSRGSDNKQEQIKIFTQQLNLAYKLKLPVIIHLRDAYEDMLEILKENKELLKFGVVVHCYSGSLEYANELLKLGCFLSFTGVITFSNAKKSVEVIKNIPLDKVMIETDCPYLAPVPLRGTLNEPKNVNLVFEKICELKNIKPQELELILRNNTRKFFNI